MNIFFLSMSIRRCAKAHFDKHVIKMIIEYTQLLSTAWHILDSEIAKLHLENQLIYRKTHINHPCCIWVKNHINNYNYVVKLGLQLCHEWRYRYNQTRLHGCELKLLFLQKNPPPNIPKNIIVKSSKNPKCLTALPKAMPDCCKMKKDTIHSGVISYRNYYKSEYKSHLVSWQGKRDENIKPDWW
jgi:hypothetical protein